MKKLAILLLTLICLHASAQITTYNINRTFSCTDTIQPFGSKANSYGISIDGSGQLPVIFNYPSVQTPDCYQFYLPLTGDYIITFTLANGDEYYGEFTVTD